MTEENKDINNLSDLSKLNQNQIDVEEEVNTSQPKLLNTCHAFNETSTVVKKRWPNYYKG